MGNEIEINSHVPLAACRQYVKYRNFRRHCIIVFATLFADTLLGKYLGAYSFYNILFVTPMVVCLILTAGVPNCISNGNMTRLSFCDDVLEVQSKNETCEKLQYRYDQLHLVEESPEFLAFYIKRLQVFFVRKSDFVPQDLKTLRIFLRNKVRRYKQYG